MPRHEFDDPNKTWSIEDLTPQRIRALAREADDRLWWEDTTAQIKRRTKWLPIIGAAITGIVAAWSFGKPYLIAVARWITEHNPPTPPGGSG